MQQSFAEQLRAKVPDATFDSVQSWRGGRLRKQSDERIVLEACDEGWTLLTVDLATIPPLIADMTRLGEEHAGVIFVPTKSFAQNDYGRLVHALSKAWPKWAQRDWLNRVEFLQRGSQFTAS